MMYDDGTLAVKFARTVIERETGRSSIRLRLPDSFFDRKGVFVTLKTFPDGDLRGCIGIPLPVLSLAEALEEAARSACHDPRFMDLDMSELDDITVEVTVLNVPRALDCPKDEIPSRIVIGRDGLILSYRGRKGLLLPQVPEEQGWDVMDYLDGICMKAGLPRGTWKEEGSELSTFSGKIFHEVTPYGDITEG